mgnify:CR=1 FL=1
MNSSIIKIVEIKCRHNSFDHSTDDLAQDVRDLLRSFPSEIIQCRLTFDNLCQIDMSVLQPLQLQRLHSLKSEMIAILQNGEDDSYYGKD